MADHSNPFSGQLVGGCFGQKGGPGPQGPNRELGPLLDPEEDPITIRLFLKGKKGLGFSPSPNTHPMEGPTEISKVGDFQAKPFQALRGQCEESTFEDLREAVALEGGTTAGIEKEREMVAEIESPQSILETSRHEASNVNPDFLKRFEISTPTVVNASSLSVFG